MKIEDLQKAEAIQTRLRQFENLLAVADRANGVGSFLTFPSADPEGELHATWPPDAPRVHTEAGSPNFAAAKAEHLREIEREIAEMKAELAALGVEI